MRDRSLAAGMLQTMDRLEIPSNLRGHLSAFIGSRIVLQDHIPLPVIRSILEADREGRLPKQLLIRVSEDMGNMHGNARVYTAWNFRDPPRDYPIDTPIDAVLDDWLAADPPDKQGDTASSAVPTGDSPAAGSAMAVGGGSLLPLVVGAGFLDGINPCALAALLFFTAFLFAARRAHSMIRALAATYVGTVLVVYFVIGLGLITTISAFTQGHVAAQIAAGLTIGMGILGILSWGIPRLRIPMPRMSPGNWERSKTFLLRATFPATIVGAALITLCTLPCSGFVYLSILGLLAAEASRSEGLVYLILYNLAYISPLVLVAIAVTNRYTARTVAQLERTHHRTLHLASSVTVLIMGLIIWTWLV